LQPITFSSKRISYPLQPITFSSKRISYPLQPITFSSKRISYPLQPTLLHRRETGFYPDISLLSIKKAALDKGQLQNTI
ncbi:hypothetical protein, partial [Lysinibacillus sp. NPDC056185]|uniref:hypothetical protein n=1 Tax=Lysinibacillus sp. NPDC056185 TaxID=3345739 RepID=UPI0039F014D0